MKTIAFKSRTLHTLRPLAVIEATKNTIIKIKKMHRFFLSHSSSDKKLAEVIAQTLKRITLNQISPWFSSDDSAPGGLQPGMIWFNAILEKLTKSKAVVAILTPNSISRPWIYFESGIGQTLDDCEVMPICIGINRDAVYPPLGLYQCYQLSDYNSLREFISKLLLKFNITFDEDMCKPVLKEALTKISEFQFEEIEENPKLRESLEDLRSHIDKRFFEIWEKPSVHFVSSSIKNSRIEIEPADEYERESTYSVPIEFNFPEYKSKKFIEISSDESFADVSTRIYFLLEDYVEAYRYLQTWALRDKKSGRLFVIREVADLIPAKHIFRPEFDIEAIPFDKPYDPEISRERVIDIQ